MVDAMLGGYGTCGINLCFIIVHSIHVVTYDLMHHYSK